MSSSAHIYLRTECDCLHTPPSPPELCRRQCSLGFSSSASRHGSSFLLSYCPSGCVLNIAWHRVSSSKQETWIVEAGGVLVSCSGIRLSWRGCSHSVDPCPQNYRGTLGGANVWGKKGNTPTRASETKLDGLERRPRSKGHSLLPHRT